MRIITVLALFLVAVNAGAILPLNQIIKPLPPVQKIKLGRPIQTIPGLPLVQPIRLVKPIHAIHTVPGQKIQIVNRVQRPPVRRNILLQKPIRTVIKKKEVVFG